MGADCDDAHARAAGHSAYTGEPAAALIRVDGRSGSVEVVEVRAHVVRGSEPCHDLKINSESH